MAAKFFGAIANWINGKKQPLKTRLKGELGKNDHNNKSAREMANILADGLLKGLNKKRLKESDVSKLIDKFSRLNELYANYPIETLSNNPKIVEDLDLLRNEIHAHIYEHVRTTLVKEPNETPQEKASYYEKLSTEFKNTIEKYRNAEKFKLDKKETAYEKNIIKIGSLVKIATEMDQDYANTKENIRKLKHSAIFSQIKWEGARQESQF